MPAVSLNFAFCEAAPLTVNTANGEASFTVMLDTVRARSSSLVTVASGVPSSLKMSPVPSSLIVPVPLKPLRPVFVAVRVKVSDVSKTSSCLMAVRTSRLPVPLSETREPAV